MAPSGPILMSIGRKATCGVLISSACSRAANPAAPEVVGEQIAAPRLGNVPAACHFEPAILGAARVQPFEHAQGVWCGVVVRARQAVIDPLTPCPVGRERLAPSIDLVAPWV